MQSDFQNTVKMYHTVSKALALSKLCPLIPNTSAVTENLLDEQLKIYYELYYIFKTTDLVFTEEEVSPFQAILDNYFIALKQLSTRENISPQYQELIHLLICGAFQGALNLKIILNKSSPTDTPSFYFRKALEYCFLNNDSIQNDWATALRFSALKFAILANADETFTLNDVILALIAQGDAQAGPWLSKNSNKILNPSEGKRVFRAQWYYEIVMWLKKVGLFTDSVLKPMETIKQKHAVVSDHLQKYKHEESMLLTEPLFNYIRDGNPENPMISRLLENDSSYKDSCMRLNLKYKKKEAKRNIYKALTENEFEFLKEVSNLKEHTFPAQVQNIILLDLYYKMYRHLKNSKNADVSIVPEIESNISNLLRKIDDQSFLYEIFNILAFQLSPLVNKKTLMLVITPTVQNYFLQAIQSDAATMFQSKWANELRQEALTTYAQKFHVIPKLKVYAHDVEKMLKHIALISNLDPKNQTEQKYILEAKTILNWAKAVKLTPTNHELFESKTLQESTSLENNEKLSKKTKANKQKLLIATPEENQNQPNPIEEAEKKKQEEIEKQKKAEARRLKSEADKLELEAKEAREQSEREKEKQIREEMQAKRAAQEAQEEARKQLEREERTRLQAEKRAAKLAEEARKKAEKLKGIAQEQADKEKALAQLALQAEQEKEALALEEQKAALEQQMAKIAPLIELNNQVAEERKQIIDDRSLSFLKYLDSFSLDTLTPFEIAEDNLDTLKKMDRLLGDSGVLEIFGSYTVFIASLRLGIPIDKVRSPSDMDLRIKLKGNNLSNYVIFVQQLLSHDDSLPFNLGFRLKFPLKPGQSLEKYIEKRMLQGGYISLSKVPLAHDPQSKEMELTLIFPAVYIANTNPFPLLKHCITIKNNIAYFNGNNTALTIQLGNTIIENSFQCNMLETLDLQLFDVVNFFPRALKNIDDWKPYFSMDKSMQDIISNLSFITDFFSIRFYSQKKHKDCYLEMAGLLQQGYFFRTESKCIMRGFLNAFFKVLNTESTQTHHEAIFESAKIPTFTKQIERGLKNHVKQHFKLYQETKEKNEVGAMFYTKVIQLLGTLSIAPQKMLFLHNCQKNPKSILFDVFAISKSCKQLNKPIPNVLVPPAPALPVVYTFNQSQVPQQPSVPSPLSMSGKRLGYSNNARRDGL